MKVVHINPNRLAGDLPGILRDLADAIEEGQVTSFVAAMERDGEYEFLLPSSLVDSLTLATLLQRRCTDRFIE